MKRWIAIALVGTLTFPFTSWSEDDHLAKVLEPLDGRSLYVQKWMAREIKIEIGSERMERALEQFKVIDVNTLNALLGDPNAFKAVLAPYYQAKLQENVVSTGQSPLLNVPRESVALLGGGLITVGSAALTGGTSIPGIAIAVSGVGLQKSLDLSLAAIESEAKETSRKLLGDALSRYRNATNDFEFKALYDHSPEEAYRKLYGHDGVVYNETLHSLEDPDKLEAHSIMLKTLQDQILANTLGQLEFETKTDSEIQDLYQRVNDVGTVVKAIRKEYAANWKAIQETQKQIGAEVNRLSDEVAQNKEDIAKNKQDVRFLQSFLFGKMTPDEQLTALDNGFFGDANSKEVRKFVELAKKRQDLMNNVGKVVNVAQSLSQIANNLNLKGPLAEGLAKAAQYGTGGYQALGQFMSGNYLAAVVTITGVFGGGRDVAGERHQQIMGALNRILEGQKVILDTVRAGFQQTFENQKKIFEAIVALSEQVAQQHREVMDKLAELHDDVRVNRSIVVNSMLGRLRPCQTFFERRDEFNYQPSGFPHFTSLREHWERYQSEFDDCQRGLSIVVADSIPGVEPDAILLSKSYDRNDGDKALRTKWFEPAVALFEQNFSNEPEKLERQIALLTSPSSTPEELEKKLSAWSNWEGDLAISQDRFETELAPESLLIVGKFLNEFHPYFQIVKDQPQRRIIDTTELFSTRSYSRKGKGYLQNLLSLVNTAIAQQAVLLGDSLLPMLYQIWKSDLQGVADVQKIVKPTPMNQAAFNLLAASSLLRKNLVTYAVYKELKACEAAQAGKGYSAKAYCESAYRTAFNYEASRTHSNLQTMLPGWPIHSVDNANYVVSIVGKDLEIPGPNSPLPGSFSFLPDTLSLLELKSRLLDEIMTYDFNLGMLKSRGRQVFWSSLLLAP